jgi:hypothetical protein
LSRTYPYKNWDSGLSFSTGKAKSRFESDDLKERGRALIEESIGFGVTHMRAFVEVDKVVGMLCLQVGLELKIEFESRCHVQICAFAQDPIFSYLDGGEEMRKLMKLAAQLPGVDALGSTPYVEKSQANERDNIKWMVDLAVEHRKHLDFHLDYNLDEDKNPSIRIVIELLKQVCLGGNWPNASVVTLGHCTRLTLLDLDGWKELRDSVRGLPIHFVGLPTSDLFMMGRPEPQKGGGNRVRGTLQIPQMIKEYGLQAAIGINNVGNAFTPQGGCDPLSVACLGVGIYQAGTKEDADILLVSGLRKIPKIGVECSQPADRQYSNVFQREPDLPSVLEKVQIWNSRKAILHIWWHLAPLEGLTVFENSAPG